MQPRLASSFVAEDELEPMIFLPLGLQACISMSPSLKLWQDI